jgi:hypothetical protein
MVLLGLRPPRRGTSGAGGARSDEGAASFCSVLTRSMVLLVFRPPRRGSSGAGGSSDESGMSPVGDAAVPELGRLLLLGGSAPPAAAG